MKRRVALIGDNSIEYVKQLLAIWNAGDCAVLIDWRIPFNKALEMMESVNVKECFIEQRFFKSTPENSNIRFHTFKVQDNGIKLISRDIADMYNENASSNEAVVLFSSGTTADAKGIVLSHYAINTNADAIQQYMKLEPSTNIQIVKSLSHSSTLVGELLVGLKARSNIFISSTLILPNRLIHHLLSSKIHIMCVNPTLLQLYCKIIELSNLQIEGLGFIYVSGSMLEPAILAKAKQIFFNTKIINVYGLTEAGPRVASQMVGFDTYAEDSVGKAIKGVEIKIEKDGKDSPILTKGEVLVKTPSKYLYLLKNGKKVVSSGQWIHTGDCGFIDEYGNVFIAGRIDSMILSSSHNVYPEEVERQINSYPGIEDSLVFQQGEHIACEYIGIRAETHEIRKFLKDKLATYEIPDTFVHVEQLPKNLNGKKIRKKNQKYV